MTNKELVSIIILSYKNYQYLYETLDSVLIQDYPNIEIVISNDGSSDFLPKEVKKYLDKNKKKNIKNFIINNNKKNIGTVKNANKAIKLSKGEYLIILAADDVFYDKSVVSKNIEAFHTLPKKESIVISQVGMYDDKLKKLIQLFVSKENKEKINNFSPKKLFGEMSSRCIIPGPGICYKKKLFNKYGYFDENYVLVEDYSFALKLSRLGVRYNYFDFVSVKHRDGGISHGNKKGEIHKSKQYDLDILKIYKKEVLPYLNLLTSSQKKDFLSKLENYQWNYSYRYEFINGTKKERRHFIVKNWKNGFSSYLSDLLIDLQDQLKGKKFTLLLVGLVLILNNNYLMCLIGYILILISITLFLIFIFKKYLPKVYRFIKFVF